MPKAVLVGLPLALFFAVVAALTLVRRPLSRVALNVLSSLLLLAYLAITAGLGIFWVANQQLPVFDWHYLFGYATVLLVAVHLAFNLRMVLAFFRRRVKPGAGEPPRARRPIAAVALALAGMAAAFTLGVRHGKVEMRVLPGASPGAWSAAVEEYHALSSHSRFGVVLRAPSVDWGEAPAAKTYPGAPRISLSARAQPRRGRSLSEAMRGPEAPRTEPIDSRVLASILHHAAGVTHERGGLRMRAAPSSGALFPAEVYLVVRAGAAVDPGLYHFDPLAPALERLGDEPRAGALGVAAEALGEAKAVAIVTAVLRRTGEKYRDRAYRYAAADIGHLAENLVIAAAEHGLAAEPLAAFDDAAAARALGVDGVEEVVLVILPLSPRLPRSLVSSTAYLPLEAMPESALGITGTVHAATSLRLAPPLAADEVAAVAPPIVVPVPPPAPLGALDAIAARESRRTFAPAPLPLAELGAILSSVTAVPARLSSAVSVHVAVFRGEGLTPGAYAFGGERALTLVRAGALQDEAHAAALSQDVIGDAAAVVVLAVDRDRLRAEGARGYRHAYLELGMLGERLLLEATARGLNACPVGAFYDEAAAALIGVDAQRTWPAHFVALGPPPR